MHRYWQRVKEQRLLSQLEESGRGALDVARNGVQTGVLMTAGLKVLGHQFWEQMQAEPEEMPKVPVMVKLLLQSEANQIQREENLIRQQAVDLRRRAQEFTERRWEYDLAEEAMARLPELQELKQAKIDANDPYAENKRVNAIRRCLYGRHDIPGAAPENDEEAATYETRRAAEEAEIARRHAEREAQWEQASQRMRPAREPGQPATKPEQPSAGGADAQKAAEPPWEDRDEENPFPFNSPETVRNSGLGRS
jgi:hypothetical protein